nr:immunoglobulin light chain junction region [Macaca mulatta]
CLQYDSVPLTF